MKKLALLLCILCLFATGCGKGKGNEVMEKVDFVVEVEEGREPIILQLADPQIIDAGQQRSPQRLSAVEQQFWASDKAEENCYVYFHIGKHDIDFWWSKSNTFETDILFVNNMQKMCGININFVDLSKVLSSMIEFSNKYPSLNINVKDRFEAFYQEYLYKLQEALRAGKETNQQ